MLGTSKSIWGFDPRSIPGCTLWLDATDSSTLTGSSPVTAWKDKSSNGYVFTGTGAVTSNYPSNTPTSLYFNGSSYLVNTALSVAAPYSFFVVAHSTSTPANYARAVNGLTTAGTDGFLIIGAYNSNSLFSHGTGGAWSSLGAYGNPTSNMWHLMGFTTAASTPNSSGYVNGTLYAGTGNAGTYAASFTSLNIGGGYGTYTYATQSWNGYIGEIIGFNYELSTSQRQTIEGYLAFKWNLTGPLVTTCAGSGTSGFADGTGTAAQFSYPFYVAKDSNDNLYVADGNNNRIRKIVPSTNVVTTFAGNGTASAVDGTGTGATINGCIAITSDYSNYLYICDSGPNAGGYGAVRRISIPGAVVTTLYTTTSSAFLQYPQAVAINRAILPTVNLYICDTYNHCIRMWSGQTAGQTIPVVAGVSGTSGQSDGTGSAARFLYPGGIEIDSTGTYAWICVPNGCRVVRMALSNYSCTTVCGSSSTAVNLRKDGPPGVANAAYPRGPVISLDGKRIYFTDTAGAPTGNNLRYYDTERSYTYTIAGLTSAVAGATNGVGLNTSFTTPVGLVITSDGIMYIPEQGGHRVRRVNLNRYWFSQTHPYATMMPFSSQFNPLDIDGCGLWLDGADYSTLTFSSGNVSTWTDKSGSNNTATSAGVAITYSSNGLYFGGSSYMTVNGFSDRLVGTPFVIFIVETLAGSGYYFGSDDYSGATDGALHTGYRNSVNHTFAFYADDLEYTGISGTGTRRVWTMWLPSGAYRQTRLNGVTVATLGNSNTLVNHYSPRIGRALGGNYYNGTISELIVYVGALTLQQVQRVEGYLAWKWNHQASLLPSNSSLLSGYSVWLDGRDPLNSGTQPAEGASVTTWYDKSGNGYNATVASGKSAATYSRLSNAVYFPTSSTAYATSYPANPTNETMFIVFNNPTGSFNNNIIIGGQVGARSLGVGYSGGGGTPSIGCLNNERSWLANTPNGSYLLGSTVVVTTQYNSTTSYVSINEGTVYSSGLPYAFTAGTTTYLGTDTSSASYYYIGYAMDIIIYNSFLSLSQCQQVRNYLYAKWNVNIHPYKYITADAPTSFIPTNITNCALWLDAGGISTNNFLFSNATSNVATWLDKSGNNRNLIVGSGTPSYSSNAVTFSGSYMYVSNAVDLTHFTFFIVVKSNTTADNTTVFGARPNTSAVYASTDGFGFYMDGTTGPRIRLYGQTSVSGQLSMFNATVSSPQVYSFTSGTNVLNGWLNGTSQSGGTGLSTRTSTAQGFSIGTEWNGSSYVNFTTYASIYEIIVYNAPLTVQQRQKVEGYLRYKWADQISSSYAVGHPYKFFMPASTYLTSTIPGTYSNFLWTKFYNITSDPSINGPGSSGWGAQIGTAGAYDPINFQDGDSRIGQSDYVGVVSKGFMYSATTTVVTFYTVSDDGIVLYFNGSQVLNNWTYHGDTANFSSSVTLPAGYTPIELRFFEWGGGFTCELYWSVGSTGTYTGAGTGVMYYNATNL